MTRGQAKKIREDFGYEYTPDSKVYNIFEVHKMIDKIYDDFESRTCENCMHNKEQDNFMIFCDCAMCSDGSRMLWHGYTKDFGCNKFEKRMRNER